MIFTFVCLLFAMFTSLIKFARTGRCKIDRMVFIVPDSACRLVRSDDSFAAVTISLWFSQTIAPIRAKRRRTASFIDTLCLLIHLERAIAPFIHQKSISLPTKLDVHAKSKPTMFIYIFQTAFVYFRRIE